MASGSGTLGRKRSFSDSTNRGLLEGSNSVETFGEYVTSLSNEVKSLTWRIKDFKTIMELKGSQLASPSIKFEAGQNVGLGFKWILDIWVPARDSVRLYSPEDTSLFLRLRPDYANQTKEEGMKPMNIKCTAHIKNKTNPNTNFVSVQLLQQRRGAKVYKGYLGSLIDLCDVAEGEEALIIYVKLVIAGTSLLSTSEAVEPFCKKTKILQRSQLELCAHVENMLETEYQSDFVILVRDQKKKVSDSVSSEEKQVEDRSGLLLPVEADPNGEDVETVDKKIGDGDTAPGETRKKAPAPLGVSNGEFVEFRVHRALLGSRSPVFQAMVDSPMLENISGKVLIPDVSPKCMGLLLRYIYSGILDEGWKNIPDEMVVAADKYEMKILIEYLDKNLHHVASADNALELRQVANLHGLAHATKSITEYIKANLEGFLD